MSDLLGCISPTDEENLESPASNTPFPNNASANASANSTPQRLHHEPTRANSVTDMLADTLKYLANTPTRKFAEATGISVSLGSLGSIGVKKPGIPGSYTESPTRRPGPVRSASVTNSPSRRMLSQQSSLVS